MQKAPTVFLFIKALYRAVCGKKPFTISMCNVSAKLLVTFLEFHQIRARRNEHSMIYWFSTLINIDAFMKTVCLHRMLVCILGFGGQVKSSWDKVDLCDMLGEPPCVNYVVMWSFSPENPEPLICALINHLQSLISSFLLTPHMFLLTIDSLGCRKPGQGHTLCY